MKRLTALLGNSQKLDGGAMFGHVPKAVWSKWLIPDELNRVTLACRALLIQEDDRNVLLETGIGAFFEPTLRERYGVIESQHVLLDSLKTHGLSDQDIDVVILSHLHFDHAGGLLTEWQQNKSATLLFPNAKYAVSKDGWERAVNPHIRDKASFIPELQDLLQHSGRLIVVDNETCDLLGKDYQFKFTYGHTPGLMHTIIQTDEGPIIFVSDLVPGTNWVHLPIAMGYDRCAELVADEKKNLLEFAVKHQAKLFYTHDPVVAMSGVEQDSNGKFTALL